MTDSSTASARASLLQRAIERVAKALATSIVEPRARERRLLHSQRLDSAAHRWFASYRTPPAQAPHDEEAGSVHRRMWREISSS